MKNILKTLLSLVIVFFLTACASSVETQPTASPSLPLSKDQTWQLVKIQGRTIDRNATPVTILFNPEAGTLRGQTPCNTYSANYTLGGQLPASENFQLSTSNFQLSNVQCPDAEMNAESRYLANLSKCTWITSTSTTLSLGNKNKTLLQFELQ